MPRIAIIGGGIGGATVAYRLKQLFGPQLPVVDVYEANKVGGRLRTINVNGLEYETGGSIIHPANQYMVKFAKEFGLSQLSSLDGGFALFKGDEKIFQTSANSWISPLQLVWRYGLDLLTLSRSTKQFLSHFNRIYKWQEEQQSYTTVPNLLMSMSDEVMDATKYTLTQLLTSKGISSRLINELGLAAARNNYGQTPDNVHGFVGSVSLAGAEPGLWAVKGGNCKVPEQLLKVSGARVIAHTVTEIANESKGAKKPLYRLTTTDGDSAEYDILVLAFPLVQGEATPLFTGFDSDFTQHKREYHRLKVYIVNGVPNYKYFGYKTLHLMPEIVFSVGDKEFYNSLGEIHPVEGRETSQRIWKVFSNSDLTESQLNTLFTSRALTELVQWAAYPEYRPNLDFVPIVLSPSMYYVNSIEQAASAMEMSALAGVNVANLVRHQWMGHDHLIDTF